MEKKHNRLSKRNVVKAQAQWRREKKLLVEENKISKEKEQKKLTEVGEDRFAESYTIRFSNEY